MSDISVTDLAGLNLVIASATARGPTTQSGTTPVNAVREFTVTGTPAQNHHEVRLRWTTRCQSIVAGLIGNGVMCEAGFGYRVDLVGGVIRLAPRGPGSLSIAAGLVGTLSVDSGSAGADGDGCQVGNRDGGATGVCMLLIAGLVLVARAGSRARRRITD